jgi:tRNA (adenine57-N1/adenine58-N1)-methyltransferase
MAEPLSGVRTGPLREGERVTLCDPKGRRHSVRLAAGAVFHTTKGGIGHDELIGAPEGSVARSVGGVSYVVFRPLLEEFTVTMPRGATVIYPKDAAHILMQTDIYPGARVLEAGVGSGALSLHLLRAIGETGQLFSYERRDDFAVIARRNVETFFGSPPPAWELRLGDLVEVIGNEPVDRAILDMLAPWECLEAVGQVLEPGGLLCCYVATTTQLDGLPARPRRLHRAGRQGVLRAGVARRGPRRPPRPRDLGAHRLPDLRPPARARHHRAAAAAPAGTGGLRSRLPRSAAGLGAGGGPGRGLSLSIPEPVEGWGWLRRAQPSLGESWP